MLISVRGSDGLRGREVARGHGHVKADERGRGHTRELEQTHERTRSLLPVSMMGSARRRSRDFTLLETALPIHSTRPRSADFMQLETDHAIRSTRPRPMRFTRLETARPIRSTRPRSADFMQLETDHPIHSTRPRPMRFTRRETARPIRATRPRAGGFTLLEMLVVLLIVGLLVAVVALAPSHNRRTDLAEEAQRLASLLESAGDEAQVRSVAISWQPVGGGYRFYRRADNGGWTPLTDDLFRTHRWAADVTGVSIRYTGSSETISRVVLGDESISVPVTITLSSEGVRLLVVGTGIGNFVVRRP